MQRPGGERAASGSSSSRTAARNPRDHESRTARWCLREQSTGKLPRKGFEHSEFKASRRCTRRGLPSAAPAAGGYSVPRPLQECPRPQGAIDNPKASQNTLRLSTDGFLGFSASQSGRQANFGILNAVNLRCGTGNKFGAPNHVLFVTQAILYHCEAPYVVVAVAGLSNLVSQRNSLGRG